MSDFDDNLEGSGDLFLDEFGEDITYHPSGGSDRAIQAIVTRLGPANLEGLPIGRAERLEIEVLNDTVFGIACSELNTGGDYVTLAARLGAAADRRRIVRLLSQDAEMIRLEVQ